MKISRRRVVVVIATVLTAIGLSLPLLSATTASAASGGFCATTGGVNQGCLNDRFNGGSGSVVQAWPLGATNEDFGEQPVGRCGGFVTHTCPFANTTFDNRYFGSQIVQLNYVPNGLCVATDSFGNAQLGKCNNTGTGFGGANGTLFIDHNNFMINLFWSNQGSGIPGDAACMEAVGTGNPIFLSQPTGTGCELWTFF